MTEPLPEMTGGALGFQGTTPALRWDGMPPTGTKDDTWHVLLDPDGDEFRALYACGEWRPDPPWGGDWCGKEISAHELSAICCIYGRPE
jgi:hypothetical protein